MHFHCRGESVPLDSFGAGKGAPDQPGEQSASSATCGRRARPDTVRGAEHGASAPAPGSATLNGQPVPRRDRHRGLRRAGALALTCLALLATPMAAHGGPNDATLSHFKLKDSSGEELPLVRPFDKTETRHYAYYTTFDSMVVLEAIPTNQNATVRFTRRPIFLGSVVDERGTGVTGTYHAGYGENRWTVVVTSANGRSTRQYSMYTRRFGPEHDPFRTNNTRSRDANLELLQVGKVGSNSTQELDPPLRTNLSVEDLQPARNRTYTVTVPHDTDQAWVRADAAAGGARVAISGNGAAGTNGDKHNFDLAYGENRVRITVTPDNRFWERVHRVKIIRELPPGESNELTGILTDLGIETEAQGGLLARTVELALSEAVRMPVLELKNHALSVNGGVLGKVTRVGGSVRYIDGRWVEYTDRWRIRVIAKQGGALTVAGNQACQLDGALCTDDGRQLEGTPSVTLAGSEVLKVSIASMASGDEDDDRIDFEVSLSREPQKLVQVRFRTIDSGANAGTATPNVDYLPADYTLEFGPGEITKTAPVALYDDTINDNGETVNVEISDARLILNRNGKSRAVNLGSTTRAVGTISNSDPLPQAWIARFGRTVADQVLDAVDARLRAARTAGAEASVGGETIGVAPPAAGPGFGGNSAGTGIPGSGTAAAARSGGTSDALEPARLLAMADWPSGAASDADAWRPGSRSMTPRELLLGTSFSLAAEADGGIGFAALWGRVAQTRFAGRERTLGIDGDVTTGLLGADYARGRWTTGLVVSHSVGDGGYGGEAPGTIEATVTAVTPWAGYALTERLSAWAAAGFGAGELTLTSADGAALSADLGMTLAAAGGRGALVDGVGPRLDAVTDARWVRTTTARVSTTTGNLTAAQAAVTQLRLGLEGSWPLALGDGMPGMGATVTPRLGLGLRHDGGDAETGYGVEISGGVELASPAQGLTVSLDGSGVLTHAASGLRDRGMTGTLAWNPPAANGRGPELTLRQTFGTGGLGGGDALFTRGTLAGLAAEDDGNGLRRRRLEARFGYGSAMFGNRFTGTPEIGHARSETGRDYSLGWRLTRAGAGPGSPEFLLEARRRESASGSTDPEYRVGFGLTAQF